MARSDLLVNLVRAGTRGEPTHFRRTVQAIVAEERAKQHHVLADTLTELISKNGDEGARLPLSNGATPEALFFELTPRRGLGTLILPPGVREICAELIEEHHRAELLRSHSLEPRHRVLLVGPPGNGKTTTAEALAHELMVPLLVVRYEALIGSYLGETAQRLGRLFEHVRMRHCLLFLDEFDTLGKERGDTHETGEIKRVVSSLLLQVDDLPSHVVVVAATNHPELLDRAVWRRFEVRLDLPAPTPSQAVEWFERLREQLGALGLSPRTLGEKLAGLSFAELEDFSADILRRHVLAGPDADLRAITRTRLRNWCERYRPESG